MGRVLEGIDGRAAEFIAKQKMFFVATAPSGDEGLVNLSPKGLDSFLVAGPDTVAYLDLTGSGIETVAHVRQNGRITIMFCSFEGPANILRLYGQGEALEPGHDDWDEWRAKFPDHPGARAIVRVKVTRVHDSCGFGVPLYEYKGERRALIDWAKKKGPQAVATYAAENNRESVDGLPGLA